jgi:hypothetical protein
MRVTHPEETEGAKILAWRRARLVDGGFSSPLAARLAGATRYDLHALIELTERGCAPELAVRILAPLEERGGAG